MSTRRSNLFAEALKYKNAEEDLKKKLSQNYYRPGELQDYFNKIIMEISRNILKIEEKQFDSDETRLYKLKRIFEKRYRKHFLFGDLTKWSFQKPFGYAGDFKIIEDIYENNPKTKGFDRLWDNYFQQMAASKATRERKEDFKRILKDFLERNKGNNIRILNLASGPAREIKELFESVPKNLFEKVKIDCLDNCKEAIDFAGNLLKNIPGINFLQKNVIRIALKKDIKESMPGNYDLIYSTGLYDYLDKKVAVRLTGNLYKLLKGGGFLVISNYREKHQNPSAYLMEWVTEWYLVYRSQEDFEDIFLSAGFSKDNIEIYPQKSGVMQYCLAVKKTKR